jgi:hypothetical protein
MPSMAKLAAEVLAAAPLVEYKLPQMTTGVPEQVREALMQISVRNSIAADAVAAHLADGGPIAKATREMAEQAVAPIKAQIAEMALAPSWAAEVKLPMAQSVFPLAEALRAQMSPALGGTFRPPSAPPVRTALAAPPISPIRTAAVRTLPPRLPSVQSPLLDPALPVRRRRPAIVRPVSPAPPPAQALPRELAEAFAHGLMRAYRQEAEELLIATGLDPELDHLRAIELRLLSGGQPDHLHAALSASVLLKGLADRLFPPQAEKSECRFQRMHDVGPKDVANRLSAYVDSRLRARLSTHEQKLFQAKLDFVFNWSGEGHHVAFAPRQAGEAFCQLLSVLATVSHARQTVVG